MEFENLPDLILQKEKIVDEYVIQRIFEEENNETMLSQRECTTTALDCIPSHKERFYCRTHLIPQDYNCQIFLLFPSFYYSFTFFLFCKVLWISIFLFSFPTLLTMIRITYTKEHILKQFVLNLYYVVKIQGVLYRGSTLKYCRLFSQKNEK